MIPPGGPTAGGMPLAMTGAMCTMINSIFRGSLHVTHWDDDLTGAHQWTTAGPGRGCDIFWAWYVDDFGTSGSSFHH